MRQYVLTIIIGLTIVSGRLLFWEFFEIDRGLDMYVGQEISCDGIIIQTPSIVLHERSRINLSVSAYTKVAYGDKISCTGIVRKTTKESLWRQRIFYEMSAKTFQVLEHDQASPILSFLYNIKSWFVTSLYHIFPSPHGELIAGLTVEGADAISKDLKDQFRRTSLSHIVALSGTNVSIVVEAVFVLLKRFRRSVRFTAGFIFIIAFALMTGLTSTILRAALMAIMALVADIFHRTYNPLRALLIVSVVMIFVNPMILMFDISFQLSFMATLSMIIVVPLIEVQAVRFVRYTLIRETLVTTLSAQVLVVPLILYYAGSLSVIAPISNLLVLPVIPAAMLFGSLAVVLQYAGPMLFMTSLPAQLIVSYILSVVQTLSALSFAAYEVHLSLVTLVVTYAVIFTVLGYAYKKAGTWPDF